MTSVAPLRLALLAGLVTVPVGASHAASLTATGFSFTGGAMTFALPGGTSGPLFAQWNPAPSAANPTALAPGLHVSFFGHGQGCAPAAGDGPAGPLDPRRRAGLSSEITPSAGATVWSPLPAPAQCPSALPGAVGPTYVAAGAGSSPIQLFTEIRPASPGRPAGFWGPYAPTGQDASGVNASIEGTFINWLFAPPGQAGLHPWADGNARHAVTIGSTQSVETAAAQAEAPGATSTQAVQEYSVSFFNDACQQSVTNKNLCQLRFIFDVDLVRKPGVDWASLTWSHYARLMFDRAEAGLPIIEGPLHPDGQPTMTGGANGAILWRSTGAATQYGTFGLQHFSARITFAQLMATLRFVAEGASAQHQPVTPAQLARLFGPRWNRPRAWTIINIGLGEELHSDGGRAADQIGGTVAALSIDP